MFWGEWKINFTIFEIFSFWDMVDFQSSWYTLNFFLPKDAQWSETDFFFYFQFWAMVDFEFNISRELWIEMLTSDTQ